MSYQFANVNGVKMHYDVQGTGPALLLIHAGIANLSMWDEQMPAFTKHFRVIRHDVRGFGETPDPAGNYTDHDDIHALLQHLGVQQVAVLGCSNGGRIAIDFTLAYPAQVTALVVIAPGLGGFSGTPIDPEIEKLGDQSDQAKKNGDFDLAAEIETQIWVDGYKRKPEQVDPVYRGRAKKLVRETVAIPIGEGVGDIVRPPAAGRLGEIKVPTLYIIGEHDMPFMFPIADAIEKGIPDLTRVDMKGTAHVPNLEKPNEFNGIVLDFLRKH